MGYTGSVLVDAPLSQVFAWHERPGALTRLMPPWLPVRVDTEAGTLRDGRTVLRLPGGLRWVGEHSDYDPPHRFVDELVSLPLRWRHSHDFAAETEATTRVSDDVRTPAPARLLRATFEYRHRQLADDLRVQTSMARLYGGPPLTVAVTGASGLVGTALSALLSTGGHTVIRLVRRSPRAPDERRWEPERPEPGLLAGVDALVHLAGASIAGRFTADHKRAVRDSRVGPTRRLAELVAASGPNGVRALISASAIGVYGNDRGDETLDEGSERGDGFVADVVADWEEATAPARDAGVRVVNCRTGLVLSARGGMLALLRPLFTAGLGGRLGDGRQWMSWIDLDDLTDIYYRALLDQGRAGPVNAVAPEPLRNADFTAALSRVLRRPALLPTPAFGPRLLLGEQGADELALASQRVLPAALTAAGHRYRRPELAGCLRHQLGRFDPPGRQPHHPL